MKTRIWLVVIVSIGAYLLFNSCSKGMAETNMSINELKSTTLAAQATYLAGIEAVPSPQCIITGTATAEEIAGILFMREEEKLARDLYTYLYGKYNLPVFSNISKSEIVHVSAVLNLMKGFNITDNSNNNAGEYVNPAIKALYAKLKAIGDASPIDALKVGVIIEQTDIADLQKNLSAVQNASIKTVYTNLLKASEAHLRAFTWNLKVRGVVYP
jgi:hypothetical protein